MNGEETLGSLLRVRPELRLLMPYLTDASGRAALAWAAIAQQWIEAVYGVAERSVAQAKLDWWCQELAAAQAGQPGHPLSEALTGSPAFAGLRPALWTEALRAGMRLREQPPATDLSAQTDAAQAFHGALACVQLALSLGPDAETARVARLASLAHLLASLLTLAQPQVDNDGLPMQLLARHGLQRHALGVDSPARRAAVRDQLRDLQKAMSDAMLLPGPLDRLTAMSAAADCMQVRRALRHPAPLAELARMRPRLGPRMAWQAWRIARKHRQATQDNS